MKILLFLFIIIFINSLKAQPEPGDVFREYIWNNSGAFLRVGGELDYGGDYIYHSTNIDLVDAVKAEIVIEKLLSHDGTYGLEIEVNEKGWILVPEAENIILPQKNYQHQIYPVIPIPLTYLNQGFHNKFRMKVNPNNWWPQNLIYGVHFRVYYDPAKKTHPTGHIVSPTSNSNLGSSVQVKVEVSNIGSGINRVEYLGKYEDIDYDGNGIYREWQYHYLGGKIAHHLGTASSAPYTVTWNTTWVPDQLYPFEIAARIVDNSGMIYFTKSISNLQLTRSETSIVLIKTYDISPAFVSRKPDRKEKFFIPSDLDRILSAQMVWTSWSPGQANGIFINNNQVFLKEGPQHAYYFHRVNLSNMSVFNEKENILSLGQSESGHHGMEVQWPGIMFLLKTDFSQVSKTAPLSPDSVSLLIVPSGIRIDWNDRADNEKGFIIEGKVASGPYSKIGRVSWVDRTFYIDTTYSSATDYSYRVSAFNDYGTSSSEEIQVTTPNQKSSLDFSSQSQYSNGVNWVDSKAGFYFIYDFTGVYREPGVLRPVFKRPYTSTYIGNTFSFIESKIIGQSFYIKPKDINFLNVDALNFGLLSEIGDELYFDSSDSSFVAISLTVSKDNKAWGMKCYSKTISDNYEIVDSTSNSFAPDTELWYRLNVTWEKIANDSIAYNAILDEYDDGAYFITRKEVLKLTGKFSNESIIADDSIFAAIVGNDHAGIEALDNFLVYDVPDSVVTRIDDSFVPEIAIPTKITLLQNYPNPFNPTTTIKYSLPNSGQVKLEIFNILGQNVGTLINDVSNAGIHKVEWNASSLPSGLYFYSLIFNGNRYEVKKMMFLK